MSIYDENPNAKTECFEKLNNGCGISCSKRGVGKLTVGSKKRCNDCVDDLSRMHPCTQDLGKEFKQTKEGLREGKTMQKMGNFFKGLGKNPEEFKLNYSSSDYGGVNWDPFEAQHAANKAAAKKAAAKKVKSIMDSENILKTLSQGPKVVPSANLLGNKSIDPDIFPLNPFTGKPSQIGTAGGGRKRRKKTKRRRKSKKSRRSKRTRRR